MYYIVYYYLLSCYVYLLMSYSLLYNKVMDNVY